MRISLQSGLNVGDQLVAQFGVATKDHGDVRNDVLNDADLLLISERFTQFGQFARVKIKALHEAQIAILNLLGQAAWTGWVVVSKNLFG